MDDLSDFEDAHRHLEEDAKDVKREIQLVADSLRLGGAILCQSPDMLAPQLVGRLLSEMDGNDNIRYGDSGCKVFQKTDGCETLPVTKFIDDTN